MRTNSGEPVAKTGPKTDPDAAHNRTIAEQIEKYRKAGWVLRGGGNPSAAADTAPERVIDTLGGHKDTRRMDITLYHPPTGRTIHINVGRGMKQRRRKEDGSGFHEVGDPQKHERKAQEDVESGLGENESFLFVPYNL